MMFLPEMAIGIMMQSILTRGINPVGAIDEVVSPKTGNGSEIDYKRSGKSSAQVKEVTSCILWIKVQFFLSTRISDMKMEESYPNVEGDRATIKVMEVMLDIKDTRVLAVKKDGMQRLEETLWRVPVELKSACSKTISSAHNILS